MSCAITGCDNAARYIRADGAHTCGVHAIGHVSEIANVPQLLKLVATMLEELDGSPILTDELAAVRGIVGRAG